MNQKKFPIHEEILIVDDSRIVQSMMKKKLSAITKAKIVQANNGADGLKIVKEASYVFRVILLDLAMPILHGIEFMQQLRELKDNKAETVVIALTGNQGNLSEAEMKDIGLNGVIIKPVDFNKLFNILNQIANLPANHWYGVIDIV